MEYKPAPVKMGWLLLMLLGFMLVLLEKHCWVAGNGETNPCSIRVKVGRNTKSPRVGGPDARESLQLCHQGSIDHSQIESQLIKVSGDPSLILPGNFPNSDCVCWGRLCKLGQPVTQSHTPLCRVSNSL